MNASSCAALMWYQLDGRERIFRLMKKLEKEDRWSFTISPEGICTVCEEKGYRRIGALKSFPGREMKVLEKELRKDRIRTVKRGKFLWLSWGKEYRQWYTVNLWTGLFIIRGTAIRWRPIIRRKNCLLKLPGRTGMLRESSRHMELNFQWGKTWRWS